MIADILNAWLHYWGWLWMLVGLSVRAAIVITRTEEKK